MLAVPLLVVGAELASQDPQLERSVDRLVAPLVKRGVFTGTILVARGEHIALHKTYGLGGQPPDETTFCVMSISKTFTATVITRLAQHGLLSLDDPVSDHLDDWPEPWNAVTVRHLLTHSSAIADHHSAWTVAAQAAGSCGLATWHEFAPRVAGKTLLDAPGALRRYSNFSYDLLGLVAEQVSGAPFSDLFRTNIIEPLGLEHTSLASSTKDATHPGLQINRNDETTTVDTLLAMSPASKGVLTGARDLHRFVRGLCEHQLIDEQHFERMLTVHRGGQADAWLVAEQAETRTVWHVGKLHGFSSHVLFCPEDGLCVVALSYQDFTPIWIITENVRQLAEGRGALTLGYADEADLQSGSMAFGDPHRHAIVLRRWRNTLAMFRVAATARSCNGMLLVPLGDGRYATPSGMRLLRLGRSEDRITHLELSDPEATDIERLPIIATDNDWLLAAAGDYAIENGPTGSIRKTDGGWQLATTLGDMELLPLAPDRAMARLTDTLATIVSFDRAADGTVLSLQWQLPSGMTMRASRKR